MHKKIFFFVVVFCLLAGVIGGISMKSKKSSLKTYEKKRNFGATPEPRARVKKTSSKEPIFVIQKHAASHLHYDFRLEIDGVLVSWAIPKGPSTDPSEKRLAVMTEDHPMDYARFEGVIPEGNYGAGTVMVWDIGTYKNLKEDTMSMSQTLKEGKIEVELHGKKLHGMYALIRTHLHDNDRNWLFFKMQGDEFADKAIKSTTKSALTNRTMQQIEKEEK